MIEEPSKGLAENIAKSSPSQKKVGAVLMQRNKVVEWATNLDTKTHPLQKKFAELAGLEEKIYLHAEIAALVKAHMKCDTIVVCRMGGHNHDELRNAKPCPVCTLALKEAGISKVYYSTDTGFNYLKLNT